MSGDGGHSALGLAQVWGEAKPSAPVTCDFVFVHGVAGHRVHTWKHGPNESEHSEEYGYFWPRDSLGVDVPGCRVFTYGYDTHPSPTSSKITLQDMADNLLVSLSRYRRTPMAVNAPIIWVCHSLGGMVFKARGGVFNPVLASPSGLALPVMIITSGDNALDHPSEKVRYLPDTDHISMCKFYSREDENYHQVRNAISAILARSGNYDPRPLGVDQDRPMSYEDEDANQHNVHVESESTQLPTFEGADREPAHRPACFASLSLASKLSLIRKRLNSNLGKCKPIPQRLEGTFEWILDHPSFVGWLNSAQRRSLLITGPPGCGKTVVADYIVRHLQEKWHRDVQFEQRQEYILSYFVDHHKYLPSAEVQMLSQFLLQLLEANELLVRHFEGEVLDRLPRGTPTMDSQQYVLDAAYAFRLYPTQGSGHISEQRTQDDQSSPSSTKIAHECTHVKNHDTISCPGSRYYSQEYRSYQSSLETSKLLNILASILNDEQVRDCYFIIDGLDELSKDAVTNILDLLNKFKTLVKVKVCLTQKEAIDTEGTKLVIASRKEAWAINLSYDSGRGDRNIENPPGLVSPDIRRFAKSQLDSLVRTRTIPANKVNEIRELLKRGKSFIWALLVGNIFASLTTMHAMDNAIHDLRDADGTNLNPLYVWIYENLRIQKDLTLLTSLHFLAHARETITLEELAVLLVTSRQTAKDRLHPLLVQINDSPLDLSVDAPTTTEELERLIPLNLRDLLSHKCLGLVDLSGHVVRFKHLSFRNFLLETPTDKELRLTVDFVMASGCLELLILKPRAGKEYRSSLGIAAWDSCFNSEKYKSYAFRHWADHMSHAREKGANLYPTLKRVWDQMSPDDRGARLLASAGKVASHGLERIILAVVAALELYYLIPMVYNDIGPGESGRDDSVLPVEVQLAAENQCLFSLMRLKDLGYNLVEGKTSKGENILDIASATGNSLFARQVYTHTGPVILPETTHRFILEHRSDWHRHANTIFLFAIESPHCDDLYQVTSDLIYLDKATLLRGLVTAINLNKDGIARFILGRLKGTNLLEKVKLGQAVIAAAKGGNIRITKLLLELGATCNDRLDPDLDHDGYSASALHYAAAYGDTGLVSLLIDKRADLDALDNRGQRPVHWACSRGHTQILRKFSWFGLPNFFPDKEGRHPLHLACKGGATETVRSLGMVDARDSKGRSALHVDVSDGALEVVLALAEMGADLDIKTNQGSTPLQIAASKGHVNIVEPLLRFGTDPNARDNEGRNALHCAILADRRRGGSDCVPAVVKLLCEYGADVTARDNDGRLALHYAARWGNVSLLPMLVEQRERSDTCWSARSHDQLSSIDIFLLKLQYSEFLPVQRLLDLIYPEFQKDNHGRTALHYAAKGKYLLTAKYLLREDGLGQDRKFFRGIDDTGNTALYYVPKGFPKEVPRSLTLLEGFLEEFLKNQHPGNQDVDMSDNDGKTVKDLVQDCIDNLRRHINLLAISQPGSEDSRANASKRRDYELAKLNEHFALALALSG